MRIQRALGLVLILVILLALPASASARGRMTPEEKQFAQDVKWTWSKSQERAFKKMSSEERAAFIGEFWKNLDPTPGTEKNEFKIIHYARIEYANRCLGGRGKKGQLDEEGRFYIVFGPPTTRNTIRPAGKRRMGTFSV